MIGRLELALERERALVADASHELRAPLAVARADVDLALRPGRSPDELSEALESVGEEVDRLVRLCDDLLLLARADRDELALEPRRVPFRSCWTGWQSACAGPLGAESRCATNPTAM